MHRDIEIRISREACCAAILKGLERSLGGTDGGPDAAEVRLRMSHKLTVRRMVSGLDSDDFESECRMVRLRVLEKLQLRRGRSQQ